MMVSGEVEHGQYQQPFIKCFVEDCGYTSDGRVSRRTESTVQPARLPSSAYSKLALPARVRMGLPGSLCFGASKKCTLPMLFIHGDADTFVPTWMVYPLYEAKPEPKELWIVPGATHAMSYKDYPQEYTEHVKKFVGKYIH